MNTSKLNHLLLGIGTVISAPSLTHVFANSCLKIYGHMFYPESSSVQMSRKLTFAIERKKITVCANYST